MMKLPKLFSGSSKLVGVFNRMLKNIEERTLLRGDGYDIEEVSGQGVRLKLKVKSSPGSDSLPVWLS